MVDASLASGRARVAANAIRAVAAIAFSMSGSASEAANYAVLQLDTGKLTIVTATTSTGSSIDRNDYQAFPLSDRRLEEEVLQTTTAALKRADPNAIVRPIRLEQNQARSLQERFEYDGPANVEQIVALLKQSSDVAPDTILLLVVPKRTEMMLDIEQGHQGNGKAAGMGFYVDRF